MREQDLEFNPEYKYAKGGKTKKFPVAVKRRIDEINEMLPKVNESGDYASTYAGSTMESYIILDKPIQIKGNYVYISEEDSRWGKYGFEKRYNVNDTRDVYESIKGRKALMSDLGIIKRAFTKLLKSEGTFAKGGIAKKSEYISNRDIVSLTHKKGGTKKTLKGSQLVDGAYAKKKIMRKKPTKSDQLSLLNKGGDIVRAYDVNNNSGVGTYAKGGKISKDDAIVKALKMGVDFNKDFHAQSFGGELTDLAKETGYRKSKSSSGSTGRAFFEHLEKRYDKNPSSYDDMAKQMARGGKMQGYNAQLDESLAMRKGAKRTKQQSDKDRRDESKAMSKSMGRRAYAGVRGMDKGRRKMANGGQLSWSYKEFKGDDALEKANKFISNNRNKYQTQLIFINDGFGVEYRPLRKMAVGGKMAKGGDVSKKEYYERMTKKLGKQGAFERIIKDSQFNRRKGSIIYTHERLPYSALIYNSSGKDKIMVSKFNEKTGRKTSKGFDNAQELAAHLDKRKVFATGGKTTMAGDTDFPNELLNYAKGGMVSVDSKNIKDIHKKYKNVSQLENGQTYAIIDGQDFNIFKDDKLKVSNNRVVGIKKPSYITGKMAKGGKVGYDNTIKKAITILDEDKVSAAQKAIAVLKPIKSEMPVELREQYDKFVLQEITIGEMLEALGFYDNYAKGGKFASGGNVSYNGWTNYATWVTNLEILDGIDWKEYNMGEPISAEQIEDYVQEVIEQSPNLALSFANRFLYVVNYRELAETANDDFDLDDGEKDEYAKGGQMKKPMIRYSGRR